MYLHLVANILFPLVQYRISIWISYFVLILLKNLIRQFYFLDNKHSIGQNCWKIKNFILFSRTFFMIINILSRVGNDPTKKVLKIFQVMKTKSPNVNFVQRFSSLIWYLLNKKEFWKWTLRSYTIDQFLLSK